MKIAYRDAGTMPYAACWRLQQELFEELLARKSRPSTPLTEGAERGAGDLTGGAEKGTDGTIGGAGGTAEKAAGGTIGGAGGTAEKAAGGIAEGAESSEQGAGGAVGNVGGSEKGAGGTIGGAGGTAEKAAGGLVGNAGGSDETIGTLLLVEHPPVYTLGKSGRAENLLVPQAEIERLGASFFRIDRGGDITFHGPGQLVGYPILDLGPLGLGLRDYVDALEETVIRTVASYGIRAGRIAGASGVWLDEKGAAPRKICAIGVRASRYVTMHGFALNVATDLDWFRRIHPCGFADRGVTSIGREIGSAPPMEEVKELIITNLSKILNVEIYK